MASRTLLLLFTISIIFTKQTETITLNKTSNFVNNQTYCGNNTLVNKQFNKTDVSGKIGKVPMKEIYAQQGVYTSPEAKNGHEFRNRYIIEQMLNEEADANNLKKTEQPSNNGLKLNTTLLPNKLTPLDNSNDFLNKDVLYIEEDIQMDSRHNDLLEALALKTAIEKVKEELSATKYKLNDETLQNAAKKHLTYTKPVPRLQYSTTRHHKANTTQSHTQIRTTQTMTENSLIAEVDNGIRKTKHKEKINHISLGQRENDIHELQRRNEFKIASKYNNKLKYIDNKSRDALSLENAQYEVNHFEDMEEEVTGVWVSKQINLEYTRKYKDKKKHLTDKPIQRPKYMTTRHHKTNIRITQSMRENSLKAEDDNGISKTEHREKGNRKTRENDIHELQRPNEFKIASKHDNKLKYIDNKSRDSLSQKNEHVNDTAEVWVSKHINLKYTPTHKRHLQKRKHQGDIVTKDKHSDKKKQNSKIKHNLETYQGKSKPAVEKKDTLNPDEVGTQTSEQHDAEIRKTLKRKNRGRKLKQRHYEKSDTMSLENENYTSSKNHLNDFQKEKVKDSKQVTEFNKPKFSQNYQKKKYHKIANKNKHIGKPKNKSEKVISNIYKRNHENKLYFITNISTKIIREDEEKNNLKVVEEDIRTVTKLGRQSDEEASLDSYEEPFRQNKSFRLPFYISTTTLAPKDKDLKHAKKKREKKTLLDDLNTVLNEKKNRNNDIALNQTINLLVSSKIFDVLTDRVAGKMLKKLQTMGGRDLLSKHQFKAKMEVKPEKVEQIGIMFKKNGDMQVMMSRENETETEKNNIGDMEAFYLK